MATYQYRYAASLHLCRLERPMESTLDCNHSGRDLWYSSGCGDSVHGNQPTKQGSRMARVKDRLWKAQSDERQWEREVDGSNRRPTINWAPGGRGSTSSFRRSCFHNHEWSSAFPGRKVLTLSMIRRVLPLPSKSMGSRTVDHDREPDSGR